MRLLSPDLMKTPGEICPSSWLKCAPRLDLDTPTPRVTRAGARAPHPPLVSSPSHLARPSARISRGHRHVPARRRAPEGGPQGHGHGHERQRRGQVHAGVQVGQRALRGWPGDQPRGHRGGLRGLRLHAAHEGGAQGAPTPHPHLLPPLSRTAVRREKK